MDAYKVKKFQIIGLPGWGDSGRDFYDVDAEVEAETALTTDEARLMLQTLLAERFQLQIHHETRMLPVYALVVSKKGFKLISNQKTCQGRLNTGTAQGNGSGLNSDRSSETPLPWAFYAQEVSIFTDRPVVDESGIDGVGYCTPDGRSPIVALLLGRDSSVYTALEDDWGMKLEPKKEALDTLVIDHVERPSKN